MVYKFPGSMHICNVTKKGWNYKTVDADEEGALEAASEQGWFATPAEAEEAHLNGVEKPVKPAPVEVAEPVSTPTPVSSKKSKKKQQSKGDFL